MSKTCTAVEVSIIIPAWNCAATIESVLDALRQQQQAPAFEVLVVDDSSTDDSVQRIQQYQQQHPDFSLHLVTQTRKAYAGGSRNAGLAQAQGRLIVFMDSDIVALPGLLKTHADYHARYPEQQTVVLGNVQIPPEWSRTPFLDISNAAKMWDSLTAGQSLHWSYFFGGNISAHKDFLLSVGGFNESYFRGEDTELGSRLQNQGMQIVYAPEAVGYHYHLRSIDDELRNNANYGKIFATYYCSDNPNLRRFAEESWYFETGLRPLIKQFLGFCVANPLLKPLTIALAKFADKSCPRLADPLWRLLFFYYGYRSFYAELKQLQHA